MSLLFKNLLTILNTKHRRFYIGGLALISCALTSNKVISAELPSVTGLQFQTSGPNRCANIGDWYTTDGTGTGPNCNNNATTSTDKIHRFNIDITQEMIDAAGGAVNITILDAESNGGGGDEVNNTSDPTRFRLLDSSGNQLDSRTVASGSANGTSVNFSVSSAGTYQITSETGARFINGNNDTGLNDDDNTFRIRVPDAGTDSRLQAQIGQFQGTMQQNTAGNISFSLYFLVGPGTDVLRLRNFDLDGRTTLTYRNPSGNSVGNPTRSGDANWNGNGNLNTGSDNLSINANTPSFADTGSWTIEVNNLNPNNQFIMEANTGENERLGLYDTRPSRAGNFEITPDTTRTATIDTPVDHPFSVSNNFTTTDIINLSLSGTEPNYTTELINASTGQPLTDIDNDGNLDTGILDPNQTIDLILRVTPTTGLTSNDTTQINAVSHMDLKVDPNNNTTRSVTKITTVLDYGDAPVSYDDTANNNVIDANDNPARHGIVSNLYLGNVIPDAETAPQSSTNADRDDNNGVDDEDAFTSLPNVTATGNYSLNVPVTNTSGGNATLHGWIDFNKNGKFELGEYKSAVVTNTSLVNLTWAVPAGTTAGNTNARFRLTSDTSLTDNGSTNNIDERSIGNANNGEVEDYKVAIAAVTRDPNLLLVKRITAINPGQSEEVRFNSFIDDPNTSDDNAQNWPNNDNIYLPGRINVADVEPGEEVEYTIYFLSFGGKPATNVKICDVVPDNMSFVADSNNSNSGIAFLNSSAAGATPTNLSNAADTDEGTFYAPGTAPPTVGNPPTNLCQKVDSTGNMVSVGAAENINGAIVVEIDSLPEAREPGIPVNSYGFIRFRARVQ